MTEPTRITEATGAVISAIDAHTFAVTLLRADKSINGYTYTPQVLESAAHLFEGATAFVDHAPGHRSVRDIAGAYAHVVYSDGALRGHLRLIDTHLCQLAAQVLEDSTTGHPTPDVGLSADLLANIAADRTVTEILRVNSVDIVFRPSAGGSFDRLIEQTEESRDMPGPTDQTTNTPADTTTTTTTNPPAATAQGGGATQVVQEAAALQNLTEQTEALRQMRLSACGDVLTLRLSASNLPLAARQRIAENFVGRIYETADLEKAIADMRALVGAITGPDTIQANGIARIHPGLSPRDRLQAATDLLMGNPVSDAVRAATPRPIGIRELFQAAGFTGQLGWERARIQEADEVTTSIMANIVGTSINKRLVSDFDAIPKWWKPIVVEVPLRDMKLQTRIKLNDFAVLPTVAEEGAYVNLAWDDVGETYTPLKKGSAVVVTLETIINDDLRAVQTIPKKLARAAAMTINAYVVALFTDTDGTGPALTDTYHIFDAAHHQSNLGADALDATSLAAAKLAIAKMTDTASHRIGLTGKWLLVPPDLEDTAYTLLYSVLKPGTADNDINALQGRAQTIVVPGFTDANNWYLLADKSEVELIEIGYLNDQRTPELLVQDDPTAGTMFTNDEITYKIRWIFGGGWLDYRGAYGAVVA